MYHIRQSVSRWLWAFYAAPARLPVLLLAARASFAAERERWLLWLPVMFGLGIAVYFGLPAEPPPWTGALIAVAGGLLALVARSRLTAVVVVGVALLMAGLGFAVIQFRAYMVDAPVIAKRTAPVSIQGRVVAVEVRDVGHRILLEDLSVARLSPAETPRRIRLVVRQSGPMPGPGDRVGLRAVLLPPPAPAAPGAFDFQRQAWFAGLGGVGFALSLPRLVEADAAGGISVFIARLRQTIATRVRDAVPGRSGAMAAALMTGDRGAIPAETVQAMRDSGLAHLLAISGLHMGLLAGCVFFAVRGGLALWPAVALRHPIKKWAAAAAIVGAFCYLLLAGATFPTQRAFVMTTIVLIAVIMDRRAVSMRLVAWAALAVLAITPESLLHVGFQMSFAAVVALVAAYEALAEPVGRLRRGGGPLRKLLVYLLGVAITTVIAGLATGLIAAYHFNRFVDYGLVANMAAVPVMAFWIMPFAVAAFALLPLGLEMLALVPMGVGVELVIRIAHTVAVWPGAVTLLPAVPVTALLAIAAGGLWLCLWRLPWRWFGLAGLGLGCAFFAVAAPPDILISGDAKLTAVRGGDGGLAVSSPRGSTIVRETWLRRRGLAAASPWPADGVSDDGLLRCDGIGCIYRAKGWMVALPTDDRALAEDCARADVVVSTVPVRGRCPAARVVIDRFDLWRNGAHAVWLDKAGIRVDSVNRSRGLRPWVSRPDAR
ncbi:MAG: ComEC family competence protein [Minwuiales bacterium]|nr:ComEC family competence protein [Minwuiales bacterium]